MVDAEVSLESRLQLEQGDWDGVPVDGVDLDLWEHSGVLHEFDVRLPQGRQLRERFRLQGAPPEEQRLVLPVDDEGLVGGELLQRPLAQREGEEVDQSGFEGAVRHVLPPHVGLWHRGGQRVPVAEVYLRDVLAAFTLCHALGGGDVVVVVERHDDCVDAGGVAPSQVQLVLPVYVVVPCESPLAVARGAEADLPVAEYCARGECEIAREGLRDALLQGHDPARVDGHRGVRDGVRGSQSTRNVIQMVFVLIYLNAWGTLPRYETVWVIVFVCLCGGVG